ncbi:SDR family oxidoreductase [Actinokineospora globicatena]|uniref:NAD(P)-dependent oxidoreductase n=1 Tax=Actinokineospora globicatena TaxID=103729 RepID=A0A9W6QL90_9PSEU|nr:SDR family oxidoreductase [Actinokineospora globicatena]GLW90637.1 NAD(P)-dependent oxidoreductase [Actinokineospora globicatena]
MDRTVLITGATGTVSTALINALRGSGLTIRALVRDERKALPDGGIHSAVGDLGEPRSLPQAFEGVHDLWLLTPNGPRAAENSMNAVWAARQAGVERVVRLSAVGAGHDAPTRSGRLHALADDQLARSGLGWTVLRPHWFMQNLLNEANDIATRGAFRLNHGAGRLGMIDVRDIAEFAAVVLTAGPHAHHGRTYTPTGPESLSFAEVAAVFSAALGRQVHYLPTGDAEIEARLLGFGVPVWIVGMLTEYARAYASGWGDFTTSDFRDVTGYEPRGLAAFVRDHADAFSSRVRSPVV